MDAFIRRKVRVALKAARLLVLLLLPGLVFAQSKKKHSLPAVFSSARYVYVESVDGDIFTPGLSRADRDAIANVQYALRNWGRYSIASDRSQAELVFVLRSGRVSEGRIGGDASVSMPRPVPGQDPNGQPNSQPNGQPRTGPPGVMLGQEGGSPDDMLQVCMLSDGSRLSAPIWMRTEPDGLASPDLPLLRNLRKAIDKEYPVDPPPSKP